MRRGHLELLMDALRTIRSESKPTWIMYELRISWRPLQRIIGELVDGGLVREVKPHGRDARTERAYELTPKGLGALDKYDELRKSLRTA